MPENYSRGPAVGRFRGAAARIDHINEIPALREAIIRDCQYLTPEFDMNWDHIQPQPGRWTFDRADALCAFAAANGMPVRGHLLIWEQGTPGWAKKAIGEPGGWGVVQHYLASTLGHYKDLVQEWDVVNEVVGDTSRSDGLRENLFFRAFGADYIRRSFEKARECAPMARLSINDYGFEYQNSTDTSRRRSFLKLLERLKKENVPLDGVGVQAHLDLSKGPLKQGTIAKFLGEISDMGLDIAITELDVLEADTRPSVPVRDAWVASEVKEYLEVALSNPAVKSVTTWGVSDRYSWLQKPSRQAVLNRGLPYDADMQPKLLHRVISRVLDTGGEA